MATNKKFRRILLKLSGEGLMGGREFGLDADTVDRICHDIRDVHSEDIQICIVIGAGNIFRGISGVKTGIERASGDYMGMLATVINSLAVQSVLETKGVPTRVQSAIPMANICEPYIRRRALRHMEKGRIVIFAAGTGNPFFTTDTAAALRAAEMNCDAVIKGTQVDGVYDTDPKKSETAQRFKKLSYDDVIARDLRVMDTSAIALSRENKIPIIVFSIHQAGALRKVVNGKGVFTVVSE
tara:strand:+ start:695 stop:1414 length:720 start_codon:yes stop_codon:yes gene_type:complete